MIESIQNILERHIEQTGRALISTPMRARTIPPGVQRQSSEDINETQVTYTVGHCLEGLPELVLCSVSPEVAQTLLNQLGERMIGNPGQPLARIDANHPRQCDDLGILRGNYKSVAFDVTEIFVKPEFHPLLEERGVRVSPEYFTEYLEFAPWQSIAIANKYGVSMSDYRICNIFVQDPEHRFVWQQGFSMQFMPDFGYAAPHLRQI